MIKRIDWLPSHTHWFMCPCFRPLLLPPLYFRTLAFAQGGFVTPLFPTFAPLWPLNLVGGGYLPLLYTLLLLPSSSSSTTRSNSSQLSTNDEQV